MIVDRRIAALFLATALALPAVAADPQPPSASGSDAVIARGDAYWYLARAYFVARQRQIGQAIDDVRRALELEPGSAPLKGEAAGLLAALGKRDEAETVAREALAIDPEEPRALRVLGELLVERAIRSSDRVRGNAGIAEAIDLFSRLTAGDDADPDDLLLLTRLQQDAGRVDEAAETARRVVERRPSDPDALVALWRALLASDRGDEAVGAVVDFLARNPGPIRAMDLEETSERIRRMIEEYDAWSLIVARGEELVASHPEVAGLAVLYGEALLRAGRHVEAVEQIERAVDLDGNRTPQRLHLLAAAYGSSGRLADASEIAEGLLRELPNHVGLLNLLAETRALRGQTDEAIETFRTAIDALGPGEFVQEPRDEFRLRIAALQLGVDRPQDALATLERLDDGSRSEALELRGRAAVEAGDDRELRRALKALRAAGGDGAGVALALEADAHVRDGDVERAIETYERAAEILGNHILGRGAEVFREHGRGPDGLTLVRRWVEADPEAARPRFRLGAYLERIGRHDEAIAELGRAVDAAPDDAEALNYLGYLLADLDRDLDRALSLIERALEIDPWNGAYLDSLGWVYYRLERYADAREPLERAAREFPNDPTVLEHLGDLFVRLDTPERAIEFWNRALAVAGDDEAGTLRAKIAALTDRADLERDGDD